ncbi:hypothetical protein DPMN_055301 [Dreissena polymorpha]|uniref:Uncharacterized protein n=1 Tax=Dreissena polymorpha TaxID=45954 RepID=A0A9D4CPQ9_DREPO|nr:hypothetical protein DPMN_055301 [Dreissena polymorpha]
MLKACHPNSCTFECSACSKSMLYTYLRSSAPPDSSLSCLSQGRNYTPGHLSGSRENTSDLEYAYYPVL